MRSGEVHITLRGVIRAALWGARGISGIWAAGWSAFAIAIAMGESDWRGCVIALGFTVAVWMPTLIAWRWPRTGGAVLLALGIWSAGFFDSRAAMVGLAIPAMLIGASFVGVGVGSKAERAWARWRAARE